MLRLFKPRPPELPVSVERSEQALREIRSRIALTFGIDADFIVAENRRDDDWQRTIKTGVIEEGDD